MRRGLLSRFALVAAVTLLAGCADVSTRITYDGLERMTFNGQTFNGWEQAAMFPDGVLHEIGTGTEVHAYVADDPASNRPQ